MPSVSRPPDSTSMVASILAVSTAGRCGTTITEETSRSLLVLRRHERHLDQLLVPFAAAPAGNSPLSRVGVFGVDIGRDHDMVAEGGVVEAHGLALRRQAGQVLERGQGPARWVR